MNHEQPNCPKCDAEMVKGFLIDQHQKNLVVEYPEQSEWVSGELGERSAFTGSIKLTGRDRRKVITYCCGDCGFLKSYALDQPSE